MPFSGKAAYDSFATIGEDISDMMLDLSPTETPFLDVLPQAPRAATNVLNQWRERSLVPDRIINSTAINSATAATGMQINGFGGNMQVGMLLEMEASGDLEIVQITSIPGPNSLLVSRQFGSSTPNSLAAGGELFVIAPAALEGADATGDVSRLRTSANNFTQIFSKPILISGTMDAVTQAPDTGSDFNTESVNRLIELGRDLEKAVFRSVRSGSSIGSDTAYRTMDGLRAKLTAINSTVAANSFNADPLAYVNDGLQSAWNSGARDLDVLAVGAQWARDISEANASEVQRTQDASGLIKQIEFIRTDFGLLRKILTPWLPSNYAMGIASSRTFVVPLQRRSFQRETLAKTGDAMKGHVVGEYTLEVHHPDKMFQLHP
jgi:hypothetical protein